MLPSLFGEGLPMVVLEAMAAGVPVVASRVEGVPEAVGHRETGLLVEPGSVSQLAQAIEEVVGGDVDYARSAAGLGVVTPNRFPTRRWPPASPTSIATYWRDTANRRSGAERKQRIS